MALCLSRARNELMLFITIILTASVLFGSAIFYAEKDENPDLISIARRLRASFFSGEGRGGRGGGVGERGT